MPLASSFDTRPFGDEDLRTLYNAGVSGYRQGDFLQAASIFTVVHMLRPVRADYAFALALALKMANRHEEALLFFLRASSSREYAARTALHAAECLLHLGRRSEAADQLRIVLAAEDADAESRQRAQAWLQLADRGDAYASNAAH
jgi:tetratricopeptide (TPR) repeat protein